LFSDGFADQFGGPKGKKFKYKQLENSLLSVSNLNVNEQNVKMRQIYFDWKGVQEQVDDILLIGIRV